MFAGHKTRVSVFSATFDGNIFRSNKYVSSYARHTRRHACKMSVRVAWCYLMHQYLSIYIYTMNSGLQQSNVSTVVLNPIHSTTFRYELPKQNVIKHLNSELPCYMPTDRQTVVDKEILRGFHGPSVFWVEPKKCTLGFLNITSHASGTRNIFKFYRVIENNKYIKNAKALNFVKRNFCSTFLFVILPTSVVKFQI
jgi:hypothetical protein